MILCLVKCIKLLNDHSLFTRDLGKISAQPHTTLCIQFLDREKNDKNNTLPLGQQICLTTVWGCAEILPGPQVMDTERKKTSQALSVCFKNI